MVGLGLVVLREGSRFWSIPAGSPGCGSTCPASAPAPVTPCSRTVSCTLARSPQRSFFFFCGALWASLTDHPRECGWRALGVGKVVLRSDLTLIFRCM